MTNAAPQQNLYGEGAREVVARMSQAADNFIASLTAEQRKTAIIDFGNSAERTFWDYTPIIRRGLPLLEMDRHQQRMAYKLIATGLSRAGFNTATTIMGLEPLLDAKEGWRTEDWFRNTHRYYITIFDRPDQKKRWGWRFEGHHVSLHYTIIDGAIVAPTPTFFGSNPAESPLNSVATLRPLAATEDLARELMYSLDDEQRSIALLSRLAPPDLVQLNRPKVIDRALPAVLPELNDPPGVEAMQKFLDAEMAELSLTIEQLEPVRYSASTPSGIAVSAMDNGQREILKALVEEYVHRMPDELAEIEMKKINMLGLENVHFAWAGRLERKQPHYYRLQGPRFLVEYDNVQNDANHIHSVWRDPENDFGVDILAHHYAHEH